jgi:hypothetical protein
VILPHFIEGGDTAHHIINTIDKEKLILLDKIIPGVTGNFGAVYENFEKDIYGALEQALPQLQKYHTLKIIFPGEQLLSRRDRKRLCFFLPRIHISTLKWSTISMKT